MGEVRVRRIGPAGFVAVAAIAASLTSQPIAAQQVRAPGSHFFQCSVERKFLAPDQFGQLPTFLNAANKGETAKQWLASDPGPESIQAHAEVEPDGSISKLSMDWLQAGSTGWPHWIRTDANDVYLRASFGSGTRYELPGKVKPQPVFDPDLLVLHLTVYSQKKFRTPIAIWLSHPEASGFGGLATVPYWRKSAEIRFGWPELRTFAANQKSLYVFVNLLTGNRAAGNQRFVKFASVDITPFPRVIEQMKLAEQDLRGLAMQASSKCTKHVVPEPAELSPEEELHGII